jgi:hypothetical protein
LGVNTEDCEEEDALTAGEEEVDLQNNLVEAGDHMTVGELAEADVEVGEHGAGEEQEEEGVAEHLWAGIRNVSCLGGLSEVRPAVAVIAILGITDLCLVLLAVSPETEQGGTQTASVDEQIKETLNDTEWPECKICTVFSVRHKGGNGHD